jgi:hypothetical protein
LAEQDSQNDGSVGLLDGAESVEDPTSDSAIGRIALKQVRVSRAEAEARTREPDPKKVPPSSSPLNRLVPYLDLFCRLSDEELSRLARTPTSAVETLRQQVEEVNRVLSRYVDLLPRLSDEELTRLTGGTAKTIRFWRLCQPRSSTETRARVDVPQALPRETSAVRSVMEAHEGDGVPQAEVLPAESGTMVVDEQLARLRRE